MNDAGFMQAGNGFLRLGALDNDLGSASLAGAEHDGTGRAGGTRRRATTMRVMLETESATAQIRSQKQPGGRCDDGQGRNFLPVHMR